MTANEILADLRKESTTKRTSPLTKIFYSNGEEAVVHFYLKNQEPSLYQQNKWNIATLNAPTVLVETSGDHFVSVEPDVV